MTWQSVDEAELVRGGRYLVAIPGRQFPVVARYTGEHWHIMYGSRISWEVTHVIPMPEMPYEYERTRTRWYERGRR